jgi:hypothetical protein
MYMLIFYFKNSVKLYIVWLFRKIICLIHRNGGSSNTEIFTWTVAQTDETKYLDTYRGTSCERKTGKHVAEKKRVICLNITTVWKGKTGNTNLNVLGQENPLCMIDLDHILRGKKPGVLINPTITVVQHPTVPKFQRKHADIQKNNAEKRRLSLSGFSCNFYST